MKRILALLLLVPAVATAQTPANQPATTTFQTVTASDKPYTPCPYPEAAFRAGAYGWTEVAFRRTADGGYTDFSVTHSSGNTDLDNATISCIGHERTSVSPANLPLLRVLYRTSVNWAIPGVSPNAPAGLPAGYQQYPVPKHISSTDCTGWYPRQDIGTGIGGRTELKYILRLDGYVSDVEVSHSSGYPELDQAAVSCVSTWRFEPFTKFGQPVQLQMGIAVLWKPS